MSFAYLPLYTGDYFRDTRGLSMAGHGCYFLLLTYCWDAQGPLPLDEERIAGICEARNQEERTTLGKVLHTYFVRMADGWYQPRMQREIERSNAISDKRSYAGREGANERMRLFRERNLASAKQVQASAKQVTETPSPSLSPAPSLRSSTPLVPAADGTRTPERRIATRLPDDWKIPEDWIAVGLAVHPDWTRAGVLRESLTFRDYWTAKSGKDATKVLWLATWRNWIRRAEREPAR